MKTRKMVTNAILIAIGIVLHQITPALGLTIQPDFALATMFIIMLTNRDYKTTLITGLIVGVFTALTTKAPGGQLPNMIDKLVTCNVMYLFLLVSKERINRYVETGILLVVGTFISGTIFVSSMIFIMGVEMPMMVMLPVVAGTAAINGVVGLAMYKIVERTGHYRKVA
ncbi:MAG: tryptophan transporter [Clostridium sp.]